MQYLYFYLSIFSLSHFSQLLFCNIYFSLNISIILQLRFIVPFDCACVAEANAVLYVKQGKLNWFLALLVAMDSQIDKLSRFASL